jgi:hypothetical protein
VADPAEERTTRGWSFGGQRFTWVALGATAAFGGSALGTWLRTESDFDDLRERCGRPCPESEIDPLERRSLATHILLGLTMASGLFTVVLFYVEGRETRRVEVGLGPGRLSVEGRF